MSGDSKVTSGIRTSSYQQPDVPNTSQGPDARRQLTVFVIFTNTAGTLVALQTAKRLTKRLDARLQLLLLYEVPYTLPLTQPAVSPGFLEEQLRAVAAQVPAEISTRILLCRDGRRTLRLILAPHSLVVVGGKRRWWSTGEQRLASLLRRNGHHVLYAELR